MPFYSSHWFWSSPYKSNGRNGWFLFIVISPQVWYVFSYFNNDAFPLFIAMILAMQVVDPESSLNRYLSGPTIRKNMSHADFGGNPDRPSPLVKIELLAIHRYF